jgi:hypothetical protein
MATTPSSAGDFWPDEPFAEKHAQILMKQLHGRKKRGEVPATQILAHLYASGNKAEFEARIKEVYYNGHRRTARTTPAAKQARIAELQNMQVKANAQRHRLRLLNSRRRHTLAMFSSSCSESRTLAPFISRRKQKLARSKNFKPAVRRRHKSVVSSSSKSIYALRRPKRRERSKPQSPRGIGSVKPRSTSNVLRKRPSGIALHKPRSSSVSAS